jgi:uncharacterized membrane protein
MGSRGGDVLARIEKSIEIKAPLEKLWPLGSFDRLPEWFNFMKKIEWTSKEKDVVGSTVHASVEVASVKSEADFEMVECVKNEKRAWRTTSPRTSITSVTTLTPTEAGTRVTFLMEYNLPYSILGKVIDKLRVSRELEKGIEQGFENLKVTAEK